MVWINTDLYSATQLFFYLGGFFVWGMAYVFVVRNIMRDKFVEVPIIAVCGNITWEYLWGFYFDNNMGFLLTLMYIGGALLDTYILIALFRYGFKQVVSDPLRQHLNSLIALSLVMWAVLYLGFKCTGYDLPLGSNSAYLVNLVMSAIYILYAISFKDIQYFSILVGWCKGIGTGMVTVFVFLTYPDNPFVLVISVLCGVLDAIYMVILYKRHAGLKREAVGV